jgi:hypothetical protein
VRILAANAASHGEGHMTKRSLAIAAAITIGAAGLWWTTLLAFDPPAFGVISVPGETVLVLNPVTPRLSFIKDAMEK